MACQARQGEGDRPARLRAAMWHQRATCTADQTGLHPALQTQSEAEMREWSLLVPECDPLKFCLMEKISLTFVTLVRVWLQGALGEAKALLDHMTLK